MTFLACCFVGGLALGLGEFAEARAWYARAATMEGPPDALEDVRETLRFLSLVNGLVPGAMPQQAEAPQVSIVIPVYQRLTETLRCLASLAAVRTVHPLEVLVSDDASFPEVADGLEQHGARVLRSEVRRSFGGNCNEAVRAARGRFVVLLNNDTVVTPDFLDPLIEPMLADPRVALVGNLQLSPDEAPLGGVRVSHAGMWFEAGQPKHAHLGEPAWRARAEAPRDVVTVTAACLAFRRDEFLAVGGFDTGYTNGYEDVDLCLRLTAEGRRVVYTPRSVIYHFGAKSETRFDREDQNRLRFLARWRTSLPHDDEPRFPRGRDLLALLPASPCLDAATGPLQVGLPAATPPAVPPYAGGRISVVVVARGDVTRLVRSLRQQSAPRDAFEVVLVETAVTPVVQGDAELPLRRIRLAPADEGQALEVGVRAARWPRVLLLGPDAVAAPGLLAAHLAERDAHAALVGRTDPEEGASAFTRWALARRAAAALGEGVACLPILENVSFDRTAALARPDALREGLQAAGLRLRWSDAARCRIPTPVLRGEHAPLARALDAVEAIPHDGLREHLDLARAAVFARLLDDRLRACDDAVLHAAQLALAARGEAAARWRVRGLATLADARRLGRRLVEAGCVAFHVAPPFLRAVPADVEGLDLRRLGFALGDGPSPSPALPPPPAPRRAQLVCFYGEPGDGLEVRRLYPGHAPRLPQGGDVRDPSVRRRQGDLARAYGVHAFCYEHPWPGPSVADLVLADGAPDLPFVLNEVPRPGLPTGRRAWAARFEALVPFFEDPRYLEVGGRPLLLVSQPARLPRLAACLATWRALARRRGLPGLHLVAVLDGRADDAACLPLFDAACESLPGFALPHGLQSLAVDGQGALVSAEEAWQKAQGAARLHPVQYRGAFAAYDDSPRRAEAAVLHVPLSATGFRNLLEEQMRVVEDDPALPCPLLFVQSWNGWGDGTAIEPDDRAGTVLLEAVRAAVEMPGTAHRIFPRTLSAQAEVVPQGVTCLVVRVDAFESPDDAWDRRAAALSLVPGVAVADCPPTHHHLGDLVRAADILVVGTLDVELLDLLRARHRAGGRSLLALRPQTLASAAARRLAADLERSARAQVDGEYDDDRVDAWVAARGETPRTLPAIPGLGKCRRFTVGPGHYEMWLDDCIGRGATGTALERLRELCRRAPRYLHARRHLVRLLGEMGGPELAEREAREVLSWAPLDTRTRAELGQVLLLQGRREEALRELTRAVDENPHQLRAWSLLLRASPPDALVMRAVESNPANHAITFTAAAALPPEARGAFLGPRLERLAPTIEPDEEGEFTRWLQAVAPPEFAARTRAALPSAEAGGDRPFGVNLSGYFRSVTGLGQGARAVARTLEAAEIPCSLDNWAEFSPAIDRSSLAFSRARPYRFNVLHANADELEPFLRRRGTGVLHGHHNIGIWNWELSTFPEAWTSAFGHLQEVWAPSTFTRDAFATVSPIPVNCMPYAVEVPDDPGMTRACFGIPDDPFCFLFAYDAYSYPSRKNPLAVVRAFRRAFGDRQDVRLVLKVLHAHHDPSTFRILVNAIGSADNVQLMLTSLARDEMYALTRLCDAYVSLHRSEGFGFPLAEAMLCGKPVVATAYSGNVDFMREENSMPVRHRLIPVERDDGPYRRGAHWADADVDHAARCMQRLVDEPGLARRLGAQARADIARELSPQAVGRRMRARLEQIASG